jgi:VanZ family protein
VKKIRSNHIFLFLYLLFILYGSLIPFTDWRNPAQSLMEVWQQTGREHVSRSDLLTNILAYIPFGFLFCSICSERLGTFGKILITTIIGSILSFSMEYTQLYLPSRTSSPIDLLLNTLSTLLGALAFGLLGKGSNIGEWFGEWRQNHFIDGRVADIGLSVIALWSASQLAPFLPSIDVGSMKDGLKPLWSMLQDLSRFNGYRYVIYALNIGSLGFILLLIKKNRARVPAWLCLYCGATFLGKITITGRQLSFEALAGLVSGVVLTFGLIKQSKSNLIIAGVCFVAVAFIVEELRPEMSADMSAGVYHDFNWIPFDAQMTENVSGVVTIIEGLWPFAALGFFAVARASAGRRIKIFPIGVYLSIVVFSLEYAQCFIIGRYPDITTVMLAVVGWSMPLLVFRERRNIPD